MSSQKKRVGFAERFPHVLVLLFAIILLAALSTYIVTPGSYERVVVEGREVIDPVSYQVVERTPVGFFGVLKSIPQGLNEVGFIIFFIFIVGGAFGIISKTGAVDAGIASLTRILEGREKIIIPAIMGVFALGGSTLGMAEETLVFIPAMVPLAIALGFDSLTGVAVVLIGAGAGFAGAFMNPFTIGIAQGIAELPIFSGMGFRIGVWFVITGIAVAFVYRYAAKIKENPELSPMYEEDQKRSHSVDISEFDKLENHHKHVLAVVIIGFLILIWGVTQYGWYITEISALFLGIGIASGLIGKLGVNGTAESFVEGARDLTMAAIIVGVARAILVVLNDGNIIDTILFSVSNAIEGLPSYFSALGMYFFQSLLNIIVPSGSGQAALTMPIMSPLSDLVGVSRQTAVLAYQLGDGFTNIWSPTSGYFMAGLGLAGVGWEKWAKWFMPLLLIWLAAGGVLVTIAHLIQYGPF
ncbi:YfcC family protein [Halanaerobium sp. Z-7514]|uniref:YfcC family protein n=1 Tax=Halanaerobium polyolivorans TaxID=2886943 RepID=A0AAW4WSI4_9FIRM|nr:YfcC family protein [Halanaerobium polyolivorans]MCC3143976.1 YfcC family protein [Halanaerobium polyolivorans]RQD79424.1 MAG: putative basic amino acid antiporter YfcC [Halanaerobium sp. MSAO_Bac5]